MSLVCFCQDSFEAISISKNGEPHVHCYCDKCKGKATWRMTAWGHMQPVTNDRVNSCGHHGAENKSSCHVADELDSLSDSDLDVMEFSDDDKFREHRSDQ